MSGTILVHVQHNWPLALAALVLLAIIVFALLTGTLPTNQGKVIRSREPASYWRWLGGLGLLLVLTIAVLFGSYLLGPA